MATTQLASIPIVPNGKRYWVLAPKKEKATTEVGSWKLEETAEKKAPPLQGRIVAVGDATRKGWRDGAEISISDMKYRRDDLVIFGAYAGNPHTFEGVDYLILHEDEILGHVIETPFDERDTTDLAN